MPWKPLLKFIDMLGSKYEQTSVNEISQDQGWRHLTRDLTQLMQPLMRLTSLGQRYIHNTWQYLAVEWSAQSQVILYTTLACVLCAEWWYFNCCLSRMPSLKCSKHGPRIFGYKSRPMTNCVQCVVQAELAANHIVHRVSVYN